MQTLPLIPALWPHTFLYGPLSGLSVAHGCLSHPAAGLVPGRTHVPPMQSQAGSLISLCKAFVGRVEHAIPC